jgi:hypothetical protein
MGESLNPVYYNGGDTGSVIVPDNVAVPPAPTVPTVQDPAEDDKSVCDYNEKRYKENVRKTFRNILESLNGNNIWTSEDLDVVTVGLSDIANNSRKDFCTLVKVLNSAVVAPLKRATGLGCGDDDPSQSCA